MSVMLYNRLLIFIMICLSVPGAYICVKVRIYTVGATPGRSEVPRILNHHHYHYHHHHMTLQPKPAPGFPIWSFLTVTFLQGRIVSPAPNPQLGGPGLRTYDLRRQGDPAITPGTGYPL
jgi:hypothetical protein